MLGQCMRGTTSGDYHQALEALCGTKNCKGFGGPYAVPSLGWINEHMYTRNILGRWNVCQDKEPQGLLVTIHHPELRLLCLDTRKNGLEGLHALGLRG